ncbi:MAG: PAS domain S-box protein, partial [Dehalococcoidia bacterium]
DGLGIITTDITERKRMEQELRHNQQRLSALIDNAPDIILSYDTNGRFLSGNRRASELLGYALEEKIGTTFDESGIFTAESLVKAKQKIETYKQGKATEPTPYELIAKDGSHLFVEVRGVPVVSGDEIEIIAIARDITDRKKTEDALRQGEEKLRAIFESISDSITVIDVNGNITDLNDAAVRLFGCKSKEETLGMNGLTFIAEDDQPSATSKFQKAATTKCVQYKFRRMDGSTFWGETSSDVLRDKSGDITGFIGIVRDISDRKKTEESLQRSEERYRRLAEDMPALVCTFLPDSTLTYVNQAYCEYFNKSADELLGSRFLNLIPGEDERRKVIDHYASLTADNPVITYEHMVEAPDGAKRWQQWTDRALFNDSGELTGYQSIGFDITERKRMEESLRHSEEKFRVIFSSIADGISVIDLTTGKVIDTNEAALHMFNYTREDVIGMNAYELIAEKDRQRAMEDLVNTLQTGDSGLAEWCLLGKGGTEHDCEARASVIRDSSWNPLYLVNVMRDITERKKIEEKLRQSEEKLRAIFESIGDGVSIINMQGKVVEVNETALRTSGYSKEEFLSKNGLELIAEKDRARAYDEMYKAFEVGYTRPIEFAIVRKDGTEYPGEAASMILRDNSGNPIGLVSILRDITERKQMEEKLRQSEEKIRQIFNSVGVGITVTDIEGKAVEVNDFGLQLCGYSKEEMIGRNGISIIAEKDRPRIIAAMIEAFQTGKSVIQEFTALKNDGSEYEVEAIATVLSDGPEKPTGLIISITDISERKRIERELTDYKENLEKMVEERTFELAKTNEELRNSEEALRNSEDKLRTMFASMADGVVVTDLEGKVKDANKAVLRLFGFDKKEDVLEMNGFDFIADRDRETAMKDMAQLFAEGLVTGRSWTFKHHPDGEFQAELSTALLKDSKGNPTDILVVMRDITERKRMEEALRVSEEK